MEIYVPGNENGIEGYILMGFCGAIFKPILLPILLFLAYYGGAFKSRKALI